MSRFKIRPQLGVEARAGITLGELRQVEYHTLDASLSYGDPVSKGKKKSKTSSKICL